VESEADAAVEEANVSEEEIEQELSELKSEERSESES
jgi:hypothetical protein